MTEGDLIVGRTDGIDIGLILLSEPSLSEERIGVLACDSDGISSKSISSAVAYTNSGEGSGGSEAVP